MLHLRTAVFAMLLVASGAALPLSPAFAEFFGWRVAGVAT